MKIQVLFGSNSDERIYGPLCSALESGADVKMEVASAHRHPARVHEVVTTCGANVFVAGAGLAAHLPGVVASLTAKPVVGIAVNGAFGGLDAFLSIVQMPKGVPVMAITEENTLSLPQIIHRWKELPKDKIYLHWNKSAETMPLQKALEDIRTQAEVPVEWCESQDAVCFGHLVNPEESPHPQGMNLLVCEKEHLSHPAAALSFFAQARKGGGWVGVNNVNNFVLQWRKIHAARV